MKTREMLVLFALALLALVAMASLASADWYVTGPCGHTWQFAPPVRWYNVPPPPAIIYDPVPIYVEPARFWHPGHWASMYDSFGNRYDRWVPGHYGNQPYRY